MVNVVDYAVKTLEGESQPIDRVLVSHGIYVGKLLKTDSRVPGRLKCDRHADFYRDVLGADEETVRIIRHGYKIPSTPCLLRWGWCPTTSPVLGRRSSCGVR